MAENNDFLTTQIITYIGNKRILIGHIQKEIELIKEKLNKKKLVCADLFSGSGIVARMLKQHSSLLIANDLENYSRILNSCYLYNRREFDVDRYFDMRNSIEKEFFETKTPGIICENYAPKDTNDIQAGERAFYTRENAERIDTYRKLIDSVDEEYRNFFLAPLLTEASIHVNTSGVFKGFYKDKNRLLWGHREKCPLTNHGSGGTPHPRVQQLLIKSTVISERHGRTFGGTEENRHCLP